jgi:hypothetical protein
MDKKTEHNSVIPFAAGDFVHPKKAVPGMVAVVAQIHSDSLSSVEVWFFTGTNSRTSHFYEPIDLEHVNSDEVPPYAVELKTSLRL